MDVSFKNIPSIDYFYLPEALLSFYRNHPQLLKLKVVFLKHKRVNELAIKQDKT